MSKRLYIYLDEAFGDKPVLVGVLTAEAVRGHEVFSMPYGQGLSLNINEHDNTLDMRLALEVAPYFGLTSAVAQTEIEKIHSIVSQWEHIARQLHISREEQERMRPAFKIKDRYEYI